MRRFFELGAAAILGDEEAVVEVRQGLVTGLIAELNLLLYGLSDSLHLGGSNQARIGLEIGGGDRISKGRVTHESSDAVHFLFGRNQVEYIQSTLLIAYRDGAAEVNHIHLEAIRDVGGGDYDLTLLFELYREPLSPKQAAELMGD